MQHLCRCVILAFSVETKLREISQSCLNKLIHRDECALRDTCLELKFVCMCVVDNDLQGTDGSGALGGPDVRRRIPIKLLSKQTVISNPSSRSQRPTARLPSNGQNNDGKHHICIRNNKHLHFCLLEDALILTRVCLIYTTEQV